MRLVRLMETIPKMENLVDVMKKLDCRDALPRLLTDRSNHSTMLGLEDNANTNDKGQDNEISDNDIRNRLHGFWLCEHNGNSWHG